MGVVVSVDPRKLYKDEITPSSEGLVFTNKDNEKLCKWEEITNIFTWDDMSVLAVTDERGDVHYGKLPFDINNKFQEQINYIYKQWSYAIKSNISNAVYVYPAWCRLKENENMKRNELVPSIVGG